MHRSNCGGRFLKAYATLSKEKVKHAKPHCSPFPAVSQSNTRHYSGADGSSYGDQEYYTEVNIHSELAYPVLQQYDNARLKPGPKNGL